MAGSRRRSTRSAHRPHRPVGERGPDLGRPVVDRVHASRHQSMKELRASKVERCECCSSSIRGARRSCCWVATRLVNGSWYEWAIPVADDLYDAYLASFGRRSDLMARTKFTELRDEVRARPGAADRLGEGREQRRSRRSGSTSSDTARPLVRRRWPGGSRSPRARSPSSSTLTTFASRRCASTSKRSARELELVAVFDDEDQRVPIHLGKDTAA